MANYLKVLLLNSNQIVEIYERNRINKYYLIFGLKEVIYTKNFQMATAVKIMKITQSNMF